MCHYHPLLTGMVRTIRTSLTIHRYTTVDRYLELLSKLRDFAMVEDKFDVLNQLP